MTRPRGASPILDQAGSFNEHFAWVFIRNLGSEVIIRMTIIYEIPMRVFGRFIDSCMGCLITCVNVLGPSPVCTRANGGFVCADS